VTGAHEWTSNRRSDEHYATLNAATQWRARLTAEGPHVHVSFRIAFGERILRSRERCAVVIADSEFDLTIFAEEHAWAAAVDLGDGIDSLWTAHACVSGVPGRVHGLAVDCCTKRQFIDEVEAQLLRRSSLDTLIRDANHGRGLASFPIARGGLARMDLLARRHQRRHTEVGQLNSYPTIPAHPGHAREDPRPCGSAPAHRSRRVEHRSRRREWSPSCTRRRARRHGHREPGRVGQQQTSISRLPTDSRARHRPAPMHRDRVYGVDVGSFCPTLRRSGPWLRSLSKECDMTTDPFPASFEAQPVLDAPFQAVSPVVYSEGDSCVVRVTGELDVATANELVTTSTAGHHPAMVIDLVGVTFMDCSGLGSLVASRLAIEADGRMLTIRGANGQPDHLLGLVTWLERAS
jgi:anti-anti-sigma factor